MKAILKNHADRRSFSFDGRNLSVAEFKTRVEGLAAKLLAEGYANAKVIATLDIDSMDGISLFFACLLLRIPFAPLNPRSPGLLLKQQLALLEARLVAPQVFCPPPHDPTVHPKKQPWNWDFGFDERALMIMTSGSTGTPKAALLSWGNLYHAAKGSIEFYQMEPDNSWRLSLPLFHVAGLMIPIRTLMAGGVTLIGQDDESATFLSYVPTQLRRALKNPDELVVLRQAKAILVGGAALSQETLRQALDEDLKISTTYGSTESSSGISAIQPGSWSGFGDMGEILPERDVCIQDGCIAFRGPTRFLGYISPKGLETPFDSRGYFRTRDLGRLEDGHLWLEGRIDDLIIVGGENISPQWVEELLEPAVPDATLHLIGVDDQEYGERPAVVIWSSEQPDVALLKTLMAQRLKGPWQPHALYWFPLDRHSGLKLTRADSRKAVRESGVEPFASCCDRPSKNLPP